MINKIPEEVYQKAILIWKKRHPDKRYLDIANNEEIEVEGYGNVKIGNRISKLRSIYEAMMQGKKYQNRSFLTEEQIAWYNEHGMIWNIKEWREEIYKQAAIEWKKKHQGQEKLAIASNETIDLEGIGTISIGYKIRELRKKYANEKTMDESLAWWDKQGMIWDYAKWQKQEQENKYKKAIKLWKEQHKEKAYLDIPETEVIVCDNEKINIGWKISSLRKLKQENILSKEEIKTWNQLGMIWDYAKWQEEMYQKAILKWKKSNHKTSDLTIPASAEINLKGYGKIRLGAKISKLRLTYQLQRQGKDLGGSKPLTEDQINWYTSQGMIWDYKDWIEKNKSKFHGDKEKEKIAKRCLNDLHKMHQKGKKEEYNITNLLTEFNVREEELIKQLDKTTNKKTRHKEKTLLLKPNLSLRQFCIENGYNYRIILNALKLHQIMEGETLEETLNRVIIDYNHKNNSNPSNWIYAKYGNLVKHILTRLNLDATAILRNMSQNMISLKAAIKHDAFLRCRINNKNNWLEEPYNYLVDELEMNESSEEMKDNLVILGEIIAEEYHLTKEDFMIIINSFDRYTSAIRGYQMYCIGLEPDEEKRIKMIKECQLSKEDIEETFFLPLEFDKKTLIGRQSELYKKREKMKQSIMIWNDLSKEEKIKVIQDNHFTNSEVDCINEVREKIDTTKAKVYTK